MTRQYRWTLLLLAAQALLFPSCQKKETASSVAATPPPGAVITETTTTKTMQVPGGATSTAESAPAGVTADPVAASHHNAERRQQHAASAGKLPRPERSAGYDEPRAAASSRRDHEVPAGTILRVAFDKTISTKTATTGETHGGELLDDLLAADGAVVAPSGSRVVGRVENAVASGKLGGQAQLKFRLVELQPQGGKPVQISTSAYERTGESHTKHDAEYIAGGAAVGALLGQLIGKDTKATIEGAAAGAAAGTGVAAATGSLDFEIQAGRTVAFTLEQPLRLPAAQ